MTETINTRCCVVGGGPAGMVLALLLARSGVDVLVLEKHADFLRDFRGDTIHPSTLEIMYELGILDDFLQRPHQKVEHIAAQVGKETITIGDFTHLPTHCKFLGLMPQWEFLDFITERARRYPTFHLKMQAEVTSLIENNGHITGVRATTPEGPIEVRADLTVGADGRRSIVREQAGFEIINIGAPMDVMWMRISRKPTDPAQSLGHIEPGKMMVMINREEYWQCAFVIPKGTAGGIRQRGLAVFRDSIAAIAPFLGDRTSELKDWKDVSLLTVSVDRLKKWSRPGLLCIGDAAHAMSPIGGVGINLAIQDAVATSNLLGPILQKRPATEHEIEAVEHRRSFPTRATQWLQVVIQNRIIQRVLDNSKPISLPFALKLLQRYKFLQRIPARVLGLGFRPEHVKTAETALAS
jgi:2-polyprenyl-6-methoxyphenol hydroxylase-like FAD-dependent oxidoreductase